ncbi:hypothetical protein DFR58_102258 [Anaerobacterium chartisolvens]|uniref:Uncharacterized protein n=1 Tax=Anaerobacterium chartisolvens TaxID=1297424 RepID=A0A369BG00_9FIRM|nr:hypothetical protein [Anaerobacterium chartisolvens]RCX20185.1 hypothetical protein DFR58_102258 [Anaerobacterium chartisolvens]
MKIKILIVLALICAVFASLTMGTLSSYISVSTFGADIYPDRDKIIRQYQMDEEQQENASPGMDSEIENIPDEPDLTELFIEDNHGSNVDLKEDAGMEDEAGSASQGQE